MKYYGTNASIAVITLDFPPVNSLGHLARSAIFEDMQNAIAKPDIGAIVLIGEGRMFSAGADIHEFDTPAVWQSPNLSELIDLIEKSPKPVVAAIHGVAMGGGLELALGTHARVATKSARFSLPESKLGLLPGAGGTQRLPRLTGLAVALDMIVWGESRTASDLADTRLVDIVVEDDTNLLSIAVEKAEEMANGRQYKRVRDLDIPVEENVQTIFTSIKNQVMKTAPRHPARHRCIDIIEKSLTLSFDEALSLEHRYFNELSLTPESRALRHLFFAERAASDIADVPAGTRPKTITRAAVIGAGTMGIGIVQCFAKADIPVMLVDIDQASLDRGMENLKRQFARAYEKNLISEKKKERCLDIVYPTLNYDALDDVDIVVEAVFEKFDLKQKIFKTLDAIVRPDTILASNTSMLDINALAAITSHPENVVGMHFFSPAHVMRLLEIVRGNHTSPDVLVSVMRLSKQLNKTAIIAGVCDGFIGNRMIEEYLRQAGFLLEEGATPVQIDKAIEKFGFAMGPFRMSDMAGNDVGYEIRKRRKIDIPNLRYSVIPDLLIEKMSRRGQKDSRGWYDYAPGKYEAMVSHDVTAMIEAYREKAGITPRIIADEEIIDRLVYSLVNEGFRIIADGIAQRESDIDVAYVAGYGFPDFRGGPMFYAHEVGLDVVAKRMRAFAANPHADPDFWAPAPGIDFPPDRASTSAI